MLTKAQNELLTQTGAGTPCGELMRRYWQPVAIARDLTDAPRAVKVLSEDLVLFRDGLGKPALIGRFCPHRGVDLSYGRQEDGGLRCVYHGWLMAADGRCLEQPGEPANSTFRDKVRQTAYPCEERGGLILAYLGPGGPPLLPSLPFLSAPAENSWAMRLRQECNYLQANEGNVDPQHLSFLHRFYKPDKGHITQVLMPQDAAPRIEVDSTPYGSRVYAIRTLDSGELYVRLGNFVMPNLAVFTGGPPIDPKVQKLRNSSYCKHHWHVPIDDVSHWKYEITLRKGGPVDPHYLAEHYEVGESGEAQTRRTLANRYLQNREEQRTVTYIGIGRAFNDHDRMATETPGPIVDRALEHLGEPDKGIIAMRRQMFAGIVDVQTGRDPLAVRRDPSDDPFAELMTFEEQLPPGTDFREFRKPALA